MIVLDVFPTEGDILERKFWTISLQLIDGLNFKENLSFQELSQSGNRRG